MTCENCFIEIMNKNQRYCSNKCFRDYRKMKKDQKLKMQPDCEYCGDKKVKLGHLRFCSWHCYLMCGWEPYTLTEYKKNDVLKECSVCQKYVLGEEVFHEYVGRKLAVMCNDTCWVEYGNAPNKYV